MLATLALLSMLGPCLWVLKVGPKYDPNRSTRRPLPGLSADFTAVRWTPDRKTQIIKSLGR
jgi:hypothetical protein